ncbi:MAG: hypothetical protein LBH35_08360 [Treponema sp.]|jgi:hypothetical protein|nr:hypothetical protein [Treponema sp.]
MALVESVLENALNSIYNQMDAAAGGTPKTSQWFAHELAKAITDQIKTAEIASGKVIVSVTGQAAGIPNTAPIGVS